MDENTNQSGDDVLHEVRSQAVQTLAGVLPQIENVDPQERFTIALNALRATDDKKLLRVALEAAQQIEDKEAQANSLIELIGEADFLIDQAKNSQL